MKHLEFVEKLNKSGISIRSTNFEGAEKRINVIDLPNVENTIIIEKGGVRFENSTLENPVRRLIKEAIDIDAWKHSWHTEIKPENYDEIQGIIQNKIIKRSEEIDLLLTVYFQINREKTED